MEPLQVIPVLGHLGVRRIHDELFGGECHRRVLAVLGQSLVKLLSQRVIAKQQLIGLFVIVGSSPL